MASSDARSMLRMITARALAGGALAATAPSASAATSGGSSSPRTSTSTPTRTWSWTASRPSPRTRHHAPPGGEVDQHALSSATTTSGSCTRTSAPTPASPSSSAGPSSKASDVGALDLRLRRGLRRVRHAAALHPARQRRPEDGGVHLTASAHLPPPRDPAKPRERVRRDDRLHRGDGADHPYRLIVRSWSNSREQRPQRARGEPRRLHVPPARRRRRTVSTAPRRSACPGE